LEEIVDSLDMFRLGMLKIHKWCSFIWISSLHVWTILDISTSGSEVGSSKDPEPVTCAGCVLMKMGESRVGSDAWAPRDTQVVEMMA
jgi:hypothetical protein